MSITTIQQLSWFQIIALKNLYDNEMFPSKIGLIKETGDLAVECEVSIINSCGIGTEMQTIIISREGL